MLYHSTNLMCAIASVDRDVDSEHLVIVFNVKALRLPVLCLGLPVLDKAPAF